MVPLVCHPSHNIAAFGFERLHPFDGRKSRSGRGATMSQIKAKLIVYRRVSTARQGTSGLGLEGQDAVSPTFPPPAWSWSSTLAISAPWSSCRESPLPRCPSPAPAPAPRLGRGDCVSGPRAESLADAP